MASPAVSLATPALAKLTAPSPARTFPRSRLYARLDAACRGRVVWIAAPAGSGKTTLVASYLLERRRPALWYQLDAADSDVASFFFHLGLAGEQAAPKKAGRLPLFTAEYLTGLPVFARNYFRQFFARLNSTRLVIFDDYHEVPLDSPLHGALREGLAEVPNGVTVIVVSRREPPIELARLRTQDDFTLLDWNELRLSPEESAGIAQLRLGQGPADSTELSTLHERAQGWVAGLILMLEQGPRWSGKVGADQSAADPLVFDYFAGEVFARTEPRMREFLLKSALLPRLTAESVTKVTELAEAEGFLVDLHRRNYFTYKHHGPADGTVYHYHPLFRQFLLSLGQQILPPAELRALKRRAAEVLVENKELEAGVALLRDLGDWGLLATLILQHAPTLFHEGRYQTLAEWLSSLPEAVLESNPWLYYDLALCRLPFNFAEARSWFEKGYRAFGERGDAAGLYLSWAGIVDTYLYEWGDFSQTDRWIAELEALRVRFPEFPTRESEVRAAIGMFALLMYHRPQHDDLPGWAALVEALVLGDIDPVLRVTAANHLVLYHCWWTGNLAKAKVLTERLRPFAASSEIAPLIRIVWEATQAACAWMTADNDGCLEAAARGLELAAASGAHAYDFMLLAQGVYAAVSSGRLTQAREWLARMRDILRDARYLDACQYHFLAFMEAARRDDVDAMTEHGSAAVRGSRDGGAPWAEGYALLALARATRRRGDERLAREHLSAARRLSAEIHSPNILYGVAQAEAEWELENQDEAAVVASLRELFAVMRAQGFVNAAWWRDSMMARLCVAALERDIEPEYVRHLVRLRGLVPQEPPLHLETWPWRIKIQTLGELQIVIDGEPLRFTGKTPKRPLELLKALIAFGGRQAGELELSEALWPDADGDAAHNAFVTTLQRLRKLLGLKEALVYQDGKLSLDARYCWVDIWALDDAAPSREPAVLQRLVALYRGPFLAPEQDAPWAIVRRERVRNKLMRCTRELVRHLEQRGDSEAAAAVFERLADVDPAIEARGEVEEAAARKR